MSDTRLRFRDGVLTARSADGLQVVAFGAAVLAAEVLGVALGVALALAACLGVALVGVGAEEHVIWAVALTLETETGCGAGSSPLNLRLIVFMA